MNMQNGRTKPLSSLCGRFGIACSLVLLAPTLASAAPPPDPAPAPAPASAPAAPEAAPATPTPSALPPPPAALPPPPPVAAPAPAAQMPPAPQPAQKGTGWGPDPAYAASLDAKLPMLPRRLDYEDGDFIPPGYELKTKATKSLVVGGLVSFLVPYGLSAIFGAAILADGNDRRVSEFGPLVIPVIGPFITIGQDDDMPPESWYRFFMLANGFTQAAGAAMFAAGILVPTKYLEFTDKIPGRPVAFVGPGSASVRLSF